MLFTLFVLLQCAIIHAQPTAKQTSAKRSFFLQIHFENRVDTQLLHLDSAYTNPHGEPFTVRNFRYYISHFSAADTKGKLWPLALVYFLIDERKPESKTISLQIPFQNLGAIQFSIGVDSSKNVSGVQTGSLDPANGMFWTWNSGYIMAKLEGTSPASVAPQHGFTYHIGGFRNGENALRKIRLPLLKPAMLSAKTVTTITIAANVNAWFAGSTAIKIKEQSSCMSPGKLAMQIADNYAGMFSVIP